MLKVTCALIKEEDKILVTQLGENSAHPFQWEFPGGKIKPGETAEQCIKRELQEELEVQVEIISALHPVQFDYGFRKIKLIPFLCQIRSGKIELNEHIAGRWASLKELQEMNLAGADRKLLHQVSNHRFLEKYFGKQMDHPGQESRPAND